MNENINEKLYGNLSEAVAFKFNFTFFICGYGNIGWDSYEKEVCKKCGKTEQFADMIYPKVSCKNDFGIFDTLDFGVCEELKNDLISHFEISDRDFRPVRNKMGDIVFYQVNPEHIMLPIYQVNDMIKIPSCPKCGRERFNMRKGFYNENKEEYFFITKEALEDLHDINFSYEFKSVVVKRPVYEYLVSKYPRMQFVPYFLKPKE